MQYMRQEQSLEITSRKRRMEVSRLLEEGAGRPSEKFIFKELSFSRAAEHFSVQIKRGQEGSIFCIEDLVASWIKW